MLEKLVCGAAAVLAIGAGPAYANDLSRFYELAQSHDAALQAAQAQREASVEARPQALAALLPQVQGVASASRERIGLAVASPQSDVSPQSGTASRLGAPEDCNLSADGQIERCTGDTHGYGLSVSQILWSFAGFSKLREANAEVASADAALQAAREDLILRVAAGYFAILSARDQLSLSRAERDAFGRLLNQARNREKTGVGPHSDVALDQSYFDDTAQGVIDARNALDDAQLAMTEITGADARDVEPLRENIPMEPPQPASADAWVAAALAGNPQLHAADLAAVAADRDIAAQRGHALPTITLNAATTRGYQELALGGSSSNDQIGVSIVWPLFQGGAVASAVRQSRALYHQAEAQLATTQRDIERQTRTAYRDVVSGIERIAVARHAVQSNRNAVEASRHDVEFGTGGEFQLLSAQVSYFAAQRAYSQTRYDYLTALLSLKEQAGQLTARDLAELDALLVPRAHEAP
ncbi:MAG: TolC family outer membrane protein [Steroidobacteraceae bacterium]